MAHGWAVEPRGEYPLDWENGTLQRGIKALAGWKCEHCGAVFIPGTNIAVEKRRKDGQPMILTVHHVDGNRSNCHYTNLISVCQRCHLHIQATWGPGDPLPPTWEQPPLWIVKRGLPYKIEHHQPSLF